MYINCPIAGLATEFMSKAEAKKYYSKKGPSSYNDIVPDFHRSRYEQWLSIIVILILRVQVGKG